QIQEMPRNFFFQAEDGIRDLIVTGVQTCALPISGRTVVAYDRLGFGRSDPHPSTLGFDFVATEGPSALRPILDTLEIDDWIGFGHSVGGGIALCAAGTVGGCRATITEAAQAFVEERTIDAICHAKDLFAEPGEIERL